MQEIQIRVKIDENDYRRVLLKMSFRRLWMFWISLPLISVVLAGIIFSGGKITSPIAYLAPLFPLFVGAVFLIPILRAAKQNALDAHEIQYTFSEKDIRTTIKSQIKIAKWSNFVSLAETKNDFILVDDAKGVYQIPKMCFSASQLVDFKELCQNKLGEKTKFI
jgi:hypothetical protein